MIIKGGDGARRGGEEERKKKTMRQVGEAARRARERESEGREGGSA